MKTFACIIVLVVALTAVQALAVQVTQVTLNYENGATVARVTADGPFMFSHQTEIPKDGKGDRMILDVIGATTGLAAKNFTELPKCGIVSIRTAQYSVTPEKVVRVVFDLTKAPVYQIEKQGNNVKITFTDNAVNAFTSWNSDNAAKAGTPAVISKPTPTVAQVAPAAAPSTSSARDKSSSIDNDRLASLASQDKPTPKLPVTPAPAATPTNAPTTPTKVVAVESKPATQTAPAPVQTPTTVVTNQKPVTTTSPSPAVSPASPAKVVVANNQPTTTPTPVPAQTPVKVVAVQTPKPATTSTPVSTTPAAVKPATPVPAVAAKPTVPAESKPSAAAPTIAAKSITPNADAAPKQPTVAPTQPVAAKPTPTVATATQLQQATTAKPTSQPVANKPTAAVQSAEKAVPQPTVVAQNNAPQPAAAPKSVSASENKLVTDAPKAVATTPVATTQTPAKPAEAANKPATAVAIPKALADNGSEQLAETDKAEAANPDLPANKSTSRFRRSAAADAKIKGTMVAEFPQRLVVKYESMGNRDPFATLIDDSRTYNTPIQNRVPNIDGLRLVGIIESDRGASDNRALFEDKNGYSYILSSGDKVQRGYVLRVENDRVYFQIFEYGWSRTVALAIENAN